MPPYVFAITAADGSESHAHYDFSTRSLAINTAGEILTHQKAAQVRVGQLRVADVEWLGVWGHDGGEARWEAAE